MTTCERYAELESAERYVAGRMTADEAADFEQHFLACDACLQTVRGVEDVRDVLAERRAAVARGEADPLAPSGLAARRSRPPKSGAWKGAAWLAAAAALIAAIGWMLGGLSRQGPPGSTGAPAPTVARDAASAPASASASAAASAQTPSTSSTSTASAPTGSASGQPASGEPSSVQPSSVQPSSGQPASDRAASGQPPSGQPPSGTPSPDASPGSGPTGLIARLAIVIPPPYVAVPVRGDAEDARKSFAAAMTRYRAGDYAGAATGLRALVAKSPDLASAQFYLGICELMTRQTRRAETALRAAADSEVTPYADEAYFYLAKAALQRGDVTAAERALIEALAREAGPGNEARRLLDEVRALGRS